MIIFSEHAKIKLQQRGIKPSFVIKTIQKPDDIFLTRTSRKIAYRKFAKLYLKVIFIEEDSDIVIITQYWDSSFKQRPKS